MMKTLLTAATLAAAMSLAACGQGPAEEAGEAADTAAEQATTGETNLGQGPMEEAGEHVDEATDGLTTPGATAPGTPPPESPATTP